MDVNNRLLKNGYLDIALYQVLYDLTTNFNAMLVKVDGDLLDATTFSATYGITDPTIGSTGRKDIQPVCLPQGKVVKLMKALRTNLNAALTIFATTAGISGTTIFTNAKLTSYLIDVPSAGVKSLGEFQGDVVEFIDAFVTAFNTALAALDADTELSADDYYSTLKIYDPAEPISSSSSSSCRSSSSSSSSSRSSSSSSSSSSSCRSSSSSSSQSFSVSSSSSSCRSSSSSSSSSCRSSSSSSSSSRSSSSSSSSSRSSSSSSRSSSSSSSSSLSSSSSSSSQSIG